MTSFIIIKPEGLKVLLISLQNKVNASKAPWVQHFSMSLSAFSSQGAALSRKITSSLEPKFSPGALKYSLSIRVKFIEAEASDKQIKIWNIRI